MRRTLYSLLALIALLSQWGLAAHAYHDHAHDDPGHICELCVSAASHVAITPSVPQLPADPGGNTLPPSESCHTFSSTPRHYPVRAPPQIL